jgi:hypothetical protein
MTSFSFGSLLAFNKDGVGVPCGQSSMSKGETCHVGKGVTGKQTGKMDESGAIAHLKKAGSASDRNEIIDLVLESSPSELRSMMKDLSADIKAAESGKPDEEWDLTDDEVEQFKKNPWGSFESFDDKKSAYSAQRNLEIASDADFRKFTKSYFSKIDKLSQSGYEKEFNRFADLAGGIGDGRSDGFPGKFLSEPSQKMNSLNLDSLLSFRQDKKCKPTSLKCGDTCLSKDPSGKKNGKGSNSTKQNAAVSSDRLREIRGNRETTKALSKSILSNPQNIFYRARVANPDGNDVIAQRKQKIAESILRAAERKTEKSERQENIREAQQRSSRISSLKTKAAKADPIALIFELREMKKRGESGSYDEKSMARDHVEVFQAELDKRIETYRSSRS